MSHEIIIYGYIEGATWRTEKYRKYQYRNMEIVSELPEDDEWPYLTASMFSSSDPDSYRSTFRGHLLHFGSTTKERGDDQRDLWISKFEALLAKLYWFSAVAHFETETRGIYKYEWKMNSEWRMESGTLKTNYDIDVLPPTSRWKRQVSSRGKIIESFDS